MKRSRGEIGFPYRKIVGPMVGASDLPFRLLTRAHGADLCYTEMLFSETFVNDESYRRENLEMGKEDHPLVLQLCGNNPEASPVPLECCFHPGQ